MADIPMSPATLSIRVTEHFPVQFSLVARNLDNSIKDLTGFDSAIITFSLGAPSYEPLITLSPTQVSVGATGGVYSETAANLADLISAARLKGVSAGSLIMSITDGANTGLAAIGSWSMVGAPTIGTP